MDITKLTGFTPGPWRVRVHPFNSDEFYVSAPMTAEHPYCGRATGIEILSDEDYPTKRADASLVAASPVLLELAKLGLELAEEVSFGDNLERQAELARALRELANKI